MVSGKYVSEKPISEKCISGEVRFKGMYLGDIRCREIYVFREKPLCR